MEYKDTLLMPKTDFPMRGNLPNKEPEWQAKWEEEKLYEKIQEKNAGRPTYILHDGPPYANGELHMGHALTKQSKILSFVINQWLASAPRMFLVGTHTDYQLRQLSPKKALNGKRCLLLNSANFVPNMR